MPAPGSRSPTVQAPSGLFDPCRPSSCSPVSPSYKGGAPGPPAPYLLLILRGWAPDLGGTGMGWEAWTGSSPWPSRAASTDWKPWGPADAGPRWASPSPTVTQRSVHCPRPPSSAAPPGAGAPKCGATRVPESAPSSDLLPSRRPHCHPAPVAVGPAGVTQDPEVGTGVCCGPGSKVCTGPSHGRGRDRWSGGAGRPEAGCAGGDPAFAQGCLRPLAVGRGPKPSPLEALEGASPVHTLTLAW